jgi:N-carbamoylputrescine amidase
LIRIALIQSRVSKDFERNLEKTACLIKKAAFRGACIVCLEELFRTPYFCQKKSRDFFAYAETVPGPTVQIFSKLCKSLKIVLILPLFERDEKNFYNTACVIDANGEILGKYRKRHIPNDPLFYEKYYFLPGDLGNPVFKTRYGKIGVLICYDQWFPEPARNLALRGAEIIFYPTAIGWKPEASAEAAEYQDSWETIQRAHAIANGVFVAAANRVGVEGELKFWGGSFVAGPFGKILVRADDREQIVTVDCDLSLIRKTRKEWPFLTEVRKQTTEDR